MRSHSFTALALVMVAVSMIPCRPGIGQVPDWASIDAGPAASAVLEQSLVVVTEGNTVKAFSAVRKQWTSLTTSFSPPAVTVLNELLIVRDGPMFYGYSPRYGEFVPTFIATPGATLLPSGSPQTWHAVVAAGNHLHVFFASMGQWSTFAFASAPAVSMGRFCFLASDATGVFAISSFHGSLVAAPSPLATALTATGNLAIASSPGMVHGFSAAKNTWATVPAAATPTVTAGNAQPAFVAIQDGASIFFFSGYTGTFSTLAATPTATLFLERTVGVVADGATVQAYSALLGTFSTLSFPTAPVVTMQQMYALFDDGGALSAFSAATGTFAPPLPSAGSQIVTRAQVATVTSPGASTPFAIYSSFRNQWDAVPVLPASTAYVSAGSAVIAMNGGGLWGWSQRSPSWVAQSSGPPDAVVVGTNPPNLAEAIYVRSGTTLYAFNPRTVAWRSVTTTAPATLVRAHYQTILAHDGANAYGFSDWTDRWSTEPLPLGYVSGGGQVQTGYVRSASKIHAYGGSGALSMTSEFPHFYRAATRGALFQIDLVAEPGAPSILAISPNAAAIPLPIGTLLLDPQSLLILAQVALPQSGALSLSLLIPDDPGLCGATFHFQAAILAPAGAYLTNSVFPTVF